MDDLRRHAFKKSCLFWLSPKEGKAKKDFGDDWAISREVSEKYWTSVRTLQNTLRPTAYQEILV